MTFAFAFHGAVLDQALAERREMPIPPYVAGLATPTSGSNRLPDDVCARRRFGRQQDRGLHFTAGVIKASMRARHPLQQ